MEINTNDLSLLWDYSYRQALIAQTPSGKASSRVARKKCEQIATEKAKQTIIHIQSWARKEGKALCQNLGASLKLCHHPLRLLNYLRIYVDERYEFLLNHHEARKNVECSEQLTEGYNAYMEAVTQFYHATNARQIKQHSQVCRSFLETLQAMTNDIEANEALALSSETIDMFLGALSTVNTLDLEMYSLSFKPCSIKLAKSIGSTRAIPLTAEAVKESCTLLGQRLVHSWNWFLSKAESLAEGIPNDCTVSSRSEKGGTQTFSRLYALKTLEVVKSITPSIQDMESALSESSPDWVYLYQHSLLVQQQCQDVITFFPSCDGIVVEILGYISILMGQIKSSDKKSHQVLREQLDIKQNQLQMMLNVLDIHRSFITHVDALRSNLAPLLKAMSEYDKVQHSATLALSSLAPSDQQVEKLIPADPIEDWTAPVDLDAIQHRLLVTADLLNQGLNTKKSQKLDNDPHTVALYQTQLNIWYLVEALDRASQGFKTQEGALQEALSTLESSYLILEQMGKMLTCSFGEHVDDRHGLLRAYSWSTRKALGHLLDIDLLKEMNHATHWVRYPMHSLATAQKVSTSSYDPQAKALLELIAHCVKHERLEDIKQLVNRSCQLAEKSSLMLSHLTEELFDLTNVSLSRATTIAPIDEEQTERLQCKHRWLGLKKVCRALKMKQGAATTPWDEEHFLQQQRSFDALLFTIDLLERQPSAQTLGFATGRAAEYLILLMRSTIETIATRKNIHIHDHSTPLALMDACQLPIEFRNFYTDKMIGINGSSRYPLTHLGSEGEWIEAIRTGALLALRPELTEGYSLIVGKDPLLNALHQKKKDYNCRSIRQKLISLLHEGANIYLQHVIPSLKST